MNATTVLTDTDMLRSHARELHRVGDDVDSGAAGLAAGIAAERWANRLGTAFLNGEIVPSLGAFCLELQEAHDKTRGRIVELAQAYHTAAIGLRLVADQYDAADR